MKAKNIMTSPAITVKADTPIRDVAAIMNIHRISGVPVVDDENKLLGVVNELHMITRNAPFNGSEYVVLFSKEYWQSREQIRQSLAKTAGELMQENPECVTPDAELDLLVELMAYPEVIHLPVVENGQVVGIVSRTDLVRLIEHLEMAPEPADRLDG